MPNTRTNIPDGKGFKHRVSSGKPPVPTDRRRCRGASSTGNPTGNLPVQRRTDNVYVFFFVIEVVTQWLFPDLENILRMKYYIESDEKKSFLCFYFCTGPLVSLPRETLDRQEQQQQDGPQYWRALEHASEEMKGDRDIVMAAVQQDGKAFAQRCPGTRRRGSDIVTAAVQQDGRAFAQRGPGRRRGYRDTVTAAV
jgi:hypothetical protein